MPLLLSLRKGTVRDELDQFVETFCEDNVPPHTVLLAAFCRARQKLKPEALTLLNDALVDTAAEHLAPQRWHGRRVLAVDGSAACLPDTPDIDQHFGRPAGNGVPLARFSGFTLC